MNKTLTVKDLVQALSAYPEDTEIYTYIGTRLSKDCSYISLLDNKDCKKAQYFAYIPVVYLDADILPPCGLY